MVSQRGSGKSKFTFTAADAGEHRVCFTPSSNSGRGNWLSTAAPNGGIKLTLDIAVGDSSAIERNDKDKLEDLATRVKDLNARLNDIRREQVFQRVCGFCSYSRTFEPSRLGSALWTFTLFPLLFFLSRMGSTHRANMRHSYRNERPSSVTSPRRQILASSGGF